MPRYKVCFDTGRDGRIEEEKGFFNDQGALAYARRQARGRPLELWRGGDLVHREAPALS
jgi:hypothetical protein